MADIPVLVNVENEREIVARFETFPEVLRKHLSKTIQLLSKQMLRRVLADEPHGKTGGLRRATHSFFYSNPDSIHGGVSIGPEGDHNSDVGRHNVKAAALEYGAPGKQRGGRKVGVGGHTRTVATMFGEAISPKQAVIAPYERNVRLDENRFLRNAVAGVHVRFGVEVEEAITDATSEFNE